MNAIQRIAAVFLALVPTAVPVEADVLVLSDGTILSGELISRDRNGIRFRCQLEGIWSSVTFRNELIDGFEAEEGDQSDAGKGAQPATKSRPAEVKPSGPVVVVIPLHGQIGGLVDDSVEGTFDAVLLAECLERAAEAHAELVILDIESPGGLVSEMEAICETIIGWHDRLRVVAWVREAFSAAAIIGLTCREMAVAPDARLGAAVIIKQGEGGLSAVDAKMASPHYARQRQYMEASGQPYEVVQAMTIQETELWWSSESGFKTTQPSDVTAWEKLDGATTILTLTDEEALRFGLASLSSEGPLQLAKALGIEPTPNLMDLGEDVRTYNERLSRKVAQLHKNAENYFGGLVMISTGLRGFVEAVKAGDREEAAKMKAQVGRGRGMSLGAANALMKTDRTLLARRIELEDDLVERFEEDKKLLGMISRLLESDTVDGLNEAIARLNTVIEGWRELIKRRG